MLWNKGKLFCDINPTCYAISLKKEICKRHIKNLLSRDKFAKEIRNEKLPVVISSYSCNIIKRAKGVDLTTQKNKQDNIILACKKINGIVIHPGEVFSFWKLVGKTSKKKGYKEGRVIERNRLVTGVGGGLCNLANTINRIVLQSPIEVTEFHKHSDALAPDEGKRIPLSAGTSINYNYLDYRFKNNTDQDVQLLVWCKDEVLYAELRCEKEFPYIYELVEEDHHFKKEGEKFYRNSKLYVVSYDKLTGEVIEKKLIWNNHSKVMFNYELIPKELIKE